MMIQHLEFIDSDHFEDQYHRKRATGKLADYIDFCWETNFDTLLDQNPKGFADVLFPNIGYTYLINLGTPFKMELERRTYKVTSDGFLPRHHYITCHHSPGNQLFGIKFKICPIVFEKDVDFSEYREHMFPLAYLIDKHLVENVKKAKDFDERVKLVFNYYLGLIEKYQASLKYINIVTAIIKACMDKNQFDTSIEQLAKNHGISKRSLQRYFEASTSFSTKPALQTLRIREAVKHMTTSPADFSFRCYNYYDYSHFSKHLKSFVGQKYISTFLTRYNSRC